MSKDVKHGMILDGIFASEGIDSSGELVRIKGLDISSLKEGKGFVNCEHILPGKAGADSTFNTIIGHVLMAKKIYGPQDCDNDREKYYWNKIELPFVYGQAELFDEEGHEGAKAAAAMIRYYVKREMPILLRFSIEGHTLAREETNDKVITRSFARGVALTIKPANHSAVSGLLEDSQVKPPEEPIVKSELCSVEFEYVPFIDHHIEKIAKSTNFLSELNKTLTAGQMGGAPSSLTDGSTLGKEEIENKKKMFKTQVMALARDWDGRGDFKQLVKSYMADTDPYFINYFDEIADDISIKGLKLKKHLEIIQNNTNILSKL